MNKKPEIPDKAYIWVSIDFDKVKHRINSVTCQIEQVIQKYQFSTKADRSAKRKN
ncbi:hypothetical protein [Nostoc sp. C117]|uniref:hypothetical protein n=1 Tax=Nostoc sp. C117 TaxID=3349875 RepID=UPI00370DA469